MGLVLLVLLLALLFGGLGFMAHALWILALVFAVIWVADLCSVRARTQLVQPG